MTFNLLTFSRCLISFLYHLILCCLLWFCSLYFLHHSVSHNLYLWSSLLFISHLCDGNIKDQKLKYGIKDKYILKQLCLTSDLLHLIVYYVLLFSRHVIYLTLSLTLQGPHAIAHSLVDFVLRDPGEYLGLLWVQGSIIKLAVVDYTLPKQPFSLYRDWLKLQVHKI